MEREFKGVFIPMEVLRKKPNESMKAWEKRYFAYVEAKYGKEIADMGRGTNNAK